MRIGIKMEGLPLFSFQLAAYLAGLLSPQMPRVILAGLFIIHLSHASQSKCGHRLRHPRWALSIDWCNKLVKVSSNQGFQTTARSVRCTGSLWISDR